MVKAVTKKAKKFNPKDPNLRDHIETLLSKSSEELYAYLDVAQEAHLYKGRSALRALCEICGCVARTPGKHFLNGGEACDNPNGPCACGGYHDGLDELVKNEDRKAKDRARHRAAYESKNDWTKRLDKKELLLLAGWDHLDNRTIDKVLEVIDMMPLGYRTEREHEVLERYADMLCKMIEDLKENSNGCCGL
jgi:hypothetical protein